MSFEGAVLGMGNPLLDISAHVPMEFVVKCVALAGSDCLSGLTPLAAAASGTPMLAYMKVVTCEL